MIDEPQDLYHRGGSPEVRKGATQALAHKLGLASTADLRRGFDGLLEKARAGRLTDTQLKKLSDAVDLLQRLDAIDRPWVFGQRYMFHRFVSTDPICPECKNAVPHRTILLCPACGAPGPWVIVERQLPSSYTHYLLVEQIRRLFGNELMLGTAHRADGMVTALPRGGAKSTWLAEIITLWLILTGRSRCLLLLSNTIKQVIERSVEIRNELEVNELVVNDFGVQYATRQERRVWTQEDFVLANNSRVVARGAMQSMRGVKNNEYRPDVVVGDDADDDKFLSSPDMARKLWEWWDNRVVPACTPNAIYMLHGTVIGEMALLWQAMNGHRGITMRKRTFRALEDDPGCNVCGMPALNPGPMDCPVCGARTRAVSPRSFWGARFTVEALKTIRQRIGHWAWNSEYQQEPHDDSTSWFEKDWLSAAKRDDLAPLAGNARRVLPWSVLSVSLTGNEAVKLATMADERYRQAPGDLGPYQVILQSWDPAWARAKPKDQKSCWMAGIGMGLTWDDKLDVFWIDRDRGLSSNQDYRDWMYNSWTESILPKTTVERPGQIGMIIERNGGGILFQFGVEEHWGSVPVVDHHTGTEKHDLVDGIPGLASWFKDNRVIIRAGGSDKQRELADELIYELKHSGRSTHTDLLMALWFGWAYINRWMRDIRDPARYNELARRRSPAA